MPKDRKTKKHKTKKHKSHKKHSRRRFSSSPSSASSSRSPSPKKKIKKDPKLQNTTVNFIPSGILQKYHVSSITNDKEKLLPTDSAHPDRPFVLFVFMNGNEVGRLHLDQPCTLIGTDSRVCDLTVAHSPVSRKHAVVQFRLKAESGQTEVENANDRQKPTRIVPYLMDLGSTNGTWIEGKQLEPFKYYQLFSEDIFFLGDSNLEIVITGSD